MPIENSSSPPGCQLPPQPDRDQPEIHRPVHRNVHHVLNPQTISTLEKPDPTINSPTHSRSATIFQSAQMSECDVFEGTGENSRFTLGVSISCKEMFKGLTRVQQQQLEMKQRRRQEMKSEAVEALEKLKEIYVLRARKLAAYHRRLPCLIVAPSNEGRRQTGEQDMTSTEENTEV
ncbi:hypothetical protein L211DRAFT_885297 [Terfezia boudieri ATCC MYA-4762]|uniref:Uncharacterized protein n=1 Tax=Terfezia boudieri ATCC MYA-4762 TaxID=1051890 RepID=A0A3N4LLY3_9PEZI|nr:hypothetical protein L211DRAFT_885297 [Terfezia boudieri ATCC MYA-4762]